MLLDVPSATLSIILLWQWSLRLIPYCVTHIIDSINCNLWDMTNCSNGIWPEMCLCKALNKLHTFHYISLNCGHIAFHPILYIDLKMYTGLDHISNCKLHIIYCFYLFMEILTFKLNLWMVRSFLFRLVCKITNDEAFLRFKHKYQCKLIHNIHNISLNAIL